MKTQGIIKIEGKELGPIVGIMGICHGNEGVGKIALDFLRNFFKTNELKRGTLYLIEGNQKAFKENTICIDNNLNRIFVEEENMPEDIVYDGYEYARQKELKPILEELDFFLDIHAANKKSPPFSITTESDDLSIKLAKIMPVDFFSYAWDDYIKGTTIQWVEKHGGTGITIECGDTNSENEKEIAIEASKIFLKYLGLYDFMDVKIKDKDKCLTLIRKEPVINKDSFDYVKNFENFDIVKSGELIAEDSEKKYIATNGGNSKTEEFVIVFPTNVDFIRTGAIKEAYLLGEFKLF